jgi:hypothetical protein
MVRHMFSEASLEGIWKIGAKLDGEKSSKDLGSFGGALSQFAIERVSGGSIFETDRENL